MKIGFETHIPLDTKTKLFSDEPRGTQSAYATGEPGTRPVLQRRAIEHGVALAVTLDMDIAVTLRFDRKQYFYPDLPKGYQITQHREPLAKKGVFTTSHGETRIKELHVEEDPSSIKQRPQDILVDDTRSGEPLIELVTEPCFNDIEEALAFLDELKTHVEYLGVLDTTKGFKTDVNISVSGTRVEVKNVTGRDNVKDALRYEAWRQRSVEEFGDDIKRETRHYDDEKKMTTPSRTKESYEDYAYIPEPDIPERPLNDIVSDVTERLPQPRETIIQELVAEGISKQEATTIASHPDKRGFYEAVRDAVPAPTAQTVITQHLPHVLDAHDKSWEDINQKQLRRTMSLSADAGLEDNAIKDVLWQTLFSDTDPDDWIESTVSDKNPKETVRDAINDHPGRVQAYKDGDKAVVNAFMGDVVREHPDVDKQELLHFIREELSRA